MLELLLAVQYTSRSLFYDGKAIYLNYLFQDYDPFVKQITMDSPYNDYNSYIFLHAERKIQDLNVYTKPVNSAEFGLVWNQRNVKIFNVLLEMNSTNENAKFFIARRARQCYVLASYFDVGSSVIRLDTAFRITSITDSSLVAKYLLSQGKPYAKFIRGNAAFTKYGYLVDTPTQFEETCKSCPTASEGNGCAQCASGTIRGLDKQCGCIYTNYKYNAFKSRCAGTDLTSTEPTQTSDQVYFFECMNRVTIVVSYYSSGYLSKTFSVFKDDSCGLNNLQIKYNYSFYNAPGKLSSSGGLAPLMTQNTSFLNVTFGIKSYSHKSDRISAFFLEAQQNGKNFLVFQNVWTQGYINEGGRERNYTEQFHYSPLFHTLDNLKMKMYNITISNYYTYSYWDGTFCSLGVGIVTNVTFDLSYLYLGDRQSDYQNPLLTFDIENSDAPDMICTSKMNIQVTNVATMMNALPKQLCFLYNHIDLDAGPKVGGFAGKLTNCTITMTMSLIALYSKNGYDKSLGVGVFASQFTDSTLAINNSVFHCYSGNSGSLGVITTVTGIENNININAAINMTGGKAESGIIGIFSAGNVNFNVYINETLAGTSGGLIGLMSAGTVTVQGAFGNITATCNEVGKWISGQIDSQTCQEDTCTLERPTNSWLGAHEVDGECTFQVSGNDPVGTSEDMYFFVCKQNTKFKVAYQGNLRYGNVSVLKSDVNCQLVNIFIRGSITNDGTEQTNINGLACRTFQNVNNITTEINITDNDGQGRSASLLVFWVSDGQTDISYSNIIVRGSYTCTSALQNSYYIGGVVAYQQGKIIYTNISFYGCQIIVYRSYYISLLTASAYGTQEVYNILVDDYNKSSPLTDFTLTSGNDEVSFPCLTSCGSQGLQLGTRFKNLLINSNIRKSFLKAASIMYDTGEIFGYNFGDNNIFSNISVKSDQYGSSNSYSGLLFGMLIVGSINIGNMYVTGESKADYACIFAFPWDSVTMNATVEYTFNNQYCGILGRITGYPFYLRLMLNMTINQPNCGAIFYNGNSGLTVNYATGIIRKVDGSYFVSPINYYDECPSGWTCSFSNSDTCPANPGSE